MYGAFCTLFSPSPRSLSWTLAKLAHQELSLLAENTEHREQLRRLQARIQDGIDTQVN